MAKEAACRLQNGLIFDSKYSLAYIDVQVDSIPLSRVKKSFARDFADGVLVAEMIHHEQPQLIELHNYSTAHSIPQKLYNWETLNQKVFKHYLHFSVPADQLQGVCTCRAGAIEQLLLLLRQKLENYKQHQLHDTNSPSRQGKVKADEAWKASRNERPEPVRRQEKSKAAGILTNELHATNELLSLKIEKLEKLLHLKDAKIKALALKLEEVNQ